jgi:hypothetical protein
MLSHATSHIERIARISRVATLGLSLAISPAWAQHRAHEHGALKLDVALQPTSISLELSTPLDNLIGFEHAPRTPAQRRQADEAVAQLRNAAALFVIDPAAQCKLASVTLSSHALGLGSDSQADNDGHADLDASINFECTNAARATHMDVKLFDAFARVQRIDVQAILPTRQLKATLKRPQGRLSLAPR